MKATILGATGLIGSHILEYLLQDDYFSSVSIIVRRKIEISHPKISVSVIDFEDEIAYKSAIASESVIFCAIGTTQKKVNGDKEKYRKVDKDIPVNAAKFGLDKGCKVFCLVSAVGADSKSSNFYTKLKGEVEDKISSLNYHTTHIFRPSLLLGDRDEVRIGEKIAQYAMRVFSFFIPSAYKAIQAKDVANAMVIASKNKSEGSHLYTYKEMQELL